MTEEDQQQLVVVETKTTEVIHEIEKQESGSSVKYAGLTVAFGVIFTILTTPLFVIFIMCCYLCCSVRQRASYTLGSAIGIFIWGLIFFVIAALYNNVFQTMCYNAVWATVTASVNISAANASDITKAKNTVSAGCASYLIYVLYAGIGLGLLLSFISFCMCYYSRKMIRRQRVNPK